MFIYFDGGNEKGIATWSVLAMLDNKVIAELTGLVHPSLPQTNNVAEWSALQMAVIYAYINRSLYDSFTISGDSELVVKQLNGEYAVGKPHLKGFYFTTKKTLDSIGKPVKIQWIPREQNQLADELGRRLRKSS